MIFLYRILPYAGKNEPQKEYNMAESFNILVYI